MYSISMAITILASVLYHIFQKSISQQINPILSMMVTYVCAMAVSLAILPLFPQPVSLSDCLKPSIWPSAALGVAIVGLEIGFLLAYRAGWDIGLAAVFSNVAVALFLLPVGLLAYKEHITPANLLGVALCVAGLILIRR